jgi:hypothetical protein
VASSGLLRDESEAKEKSPELQWRGNIRRLLSAYVCFSARVSSCVSVYLCVMCASEGHKAMRSLAELESSSH